MTFLLFAEQMLNGLQFGIMLFLMAAAMPIAFATWSALLNNFVIEVAQFDGSDIGWLHTVREIPGFLAIAKGCLSRNASGAPKMNPLLSIPTTISISLLLNSSQKISIDSLKAS